MTSIDRVLAIGLVLFPLIGSACALITGLRGRKALVAPCGTLGVAAATGASLWMLLRVFHGGARSFVVGGWSAAAGIVLVVDLPAASILLVVGVVSLAILAYALGSKHDEMVFIVVFGIALAGLAAVVLADDLFNLFVALEVVSLAAVILVAYQRTPRALYAAFRYLVISTVSIALYLVGVLVLYRESGELALSRIALVLAGGSVSAMEGSAIPVATALIVTGLATRVAIVPFHVWLPDAHGSAPNPVSALLSGLVLKAGFFALWRVVRVLPPGAGRLHLVLLAFGAVSALVGVVLALVQSDAKRLLAYHSVSQMGLIVLGAGAAGMGVAGVGDAAYTGTVFHALSHATFKSLLFLVVGVMVVRWNTHNLYTIREKNRSLLPARYEQMIYLVGAGAIAGVPGLSGFVGKTLIGTGLKDYTFLYTLVKIVSVGTMASFIKLGTAFFPGGTIGLKDHGDAGRKRDRMKAVPRAEALPMLMRLGLFITAAGTVGLGIAGGLAARVFTARDVSDSAMILGAGVVLYLVVSSPRGRALSHRIGGLRLGLDAAVICVLAGALLLAVVV